MARTKSSSIAKVSNEKSKVFMTNGAAIAQSLGLKRTSLGRSSTNKKGDLSSSKKPEEGSFMKSTDRAESQPAKKTHALHKQDSHSYLKQTTVTGSAQVTLT